ncbi:hypothetical protein K1719_028143 [Acacia pycnantha]|nr:hypothetical protein K1719_028143 [Acacia pycnantha]
MSPPSLYADNHTHMHYVFCIGLDRSVLRGEGFVGSASSSSAPGYGSRPPTSSLFITPFLREKGYMENIGTCVQDLGGRIWRTCDIAAICLPFNAIEVSNRR